MRKSTIRIGEAIYSILKPFKRVYPLVADEGTNFPFVVYGRNSGYSQSDKDGIYSAIANVNVKVAAQEYDESVELADKIVNEMEKTVGDVQGFNIWQIRMIDSNEVFYDNAFIQEMQFQVEFSTTEYVNNSKPEKPNHGNPDFNKPNHKH